MRDNYGDHWYSDGYVVPYDDSGLGNKGLWQAYPAQYPDWKALPNWQPQRDRWYCYELMVKLNTPGQNDGEGKYWIDGNVVGDFPDLNIRSIPTLKVDTATIALHALHSEQGNKKWYDNVVIATKYIGPMTTATPSPTPTTTPTPTPTATPSATATPTPAWSPTATPSPGLTPTPTPNPGRRHRHRGKKWQTRYERLNAVSPTPAPGQSVDASETPR